MQTRSTVVFLLSLLIAPAWAADGVAPKIFAGITIGAAFAYPQCPRKAADPEVAKYLASSEYAYPVDHICWGRSPGYIDDPRRADTDGWLPMTLPLGSAPEYIVPDSMAVCVISKSIEGARFIFRMTNIDAVREDMIHKYGQPTSHRLEKVMNGFGAQFQSATYAWKFKDAMVILGARTESTDSGSVTIETAKCADVESATRRTRSRL